MERPTSTTDHGKTITDRVQALMTAHEISGAELARRIGATQSYVARRLRGEVPWRAYDLRAIATALGEPVTELIS